MWLCPLPSNRGVPNEQKDMDLRGSRCSSLGSSGLLGDAGGAHWDTEKELWLCQPLLTAAQMGMCSHGDGHKSSSLGEALAQGSCPTAAKPRF